MRVAAFAVAMLLAPACGSTRPVEVPPPYSDFGIFVTLRPRVYIDWLGFETLRGTAENRTGRDMDLGLYLILLDDTGFVVGQASAYMDDFRTGTRRSFEVFLPCGTPGNPTLFGKPLPFSKVKRGWIIDGRALNALVESLSREHRVEPCEDARAQR